MIIVISGTPGTGKHLIGTSIAKSLGYKLLDLNNFISPGKSREKSVSIRKINKIASDNIADDTVIVSHLAHFIRSDKVDFWVVLRCSPLVLYKRLSKRGYTKDKIYDNVLFEAIDGTYIESIGMHPKTVQIDNTSNPDKTVKSLLKLFKGGRILEKRIDYSGQIKKITQLFK
jgi:adenylate kinase